VKNRTATFLAALACVGVGILAGAGAIGLCWLSGIPLNSKQQMVSLFGFSLIGLIYAVVIATSPPGRLPRLRK
jgi:hypothetical protein